MISCARRLERGKRGIEPCHLGLIPFVARHMGLPEIMVDGE